MLGADGVDKLKVNVAR